MPVVAACDDYFGPGGRHNGEQTIGVEGAKRESTDECDSGLGQGWNPEHGGELVQGDQD